VKASQSQPTPAGESKSPWQKTSFANLVRYVPSGTYFARLRVKGKLHFRSLKTKTLSVAKLKLSDFEKAERGAVENQTRLEEGKVTFQDLINEYKARLETNPASKPRSRVYRHECLDRLLQTWPVLPKLEARRIGKDECEQWAGKFV